MFLTSLLLSLEKQDEDDVMFRLDAIVLAMGGDDKFAYSKSATF